MLASRLVLPQAGMPKIRIALASFLFWSGAACVLAVRLVLPQAGMPKIRIGGELGLSGLKRGGGVGNNRSGVWFFR